MKKKKPKLTEAKAKVNNEIMITAEEFFRNKIKEQNPNREVVTLSQELITAEQGMRWANEFKQLHLHSVVGQSEQLVCDCGNKLTETPADAKPVLCEGLECPDCGGCMEQNDTTYSNVNTSRARAGQHTGDIYFCEHCEQHYIDNLLTGNVEAWSY